MNKEETFEKWKQAADLAIDTEYGMATEERKARLKEEFRNFVDTRKFNIPLDWDDVYCEFVEHFERYENTIMSSDGNGHKTVKEYFYRQLEMVAILSTRMVGPSDEPGVFIMSDVANILFNQSYPSGTMVLI